VVLAGLVVGPLIGIASAASPTVTIQGGLSGNPTDGQVIAVSGTGFPTPSQDPTGLVILECSDPGGTTANLPTTADSCDGTTSSQNPINTTTSGTFTDVGGYTVAALSTSAGSNINCDATDYCVLWVGVDYEGNFTTTGQYAFSRPFEINAPPPLAPEAPYVIALPIAGVLAAGGTLFFIRRRRRNHAPVAA
jgi:LPXTG-motif cell wall-anchored protein